MRCLILLLLLGLFFSCTKETLTADPPCMDHPGHDCPTVCSYHFNQNPYGVDSCELSFHFYFKPEDIVDTFNLIISNDTFVAIPYGNNTHGVAGFVMLGCIDSIEVYIKAINNSTFGTCTGSLKLPIE